MKRKLIGAGAFAVASALAFMSTAYACTIWLGQLKVTGNASGGGTVVATGSKKDMSWKSVSSGIAKMSGSSPSLTLSVNSDPADTSNKLPRTKSDGTVINYYLIFDDYTGPTDGMHPTHTTWRYDCMYGDQFGQYFGPVNVTTSGSGGNWTIKPKSTLNRTPKDLNGVYYNEASVCISDTTALYGNQAPVTIV